ncbi:hypothetical protein [Enterobacter sp. RHBSTW-01064]|nr:hypothetical protein [Enterobacter sp. RHBSTW-01064]
MNLTLISRDSRADAATAVPHVRAQGDYFLIGEIGSEDPDVLSRYPKSAN